MEGTRPRCPGSPATVARPGDAHVVVQTVQEAPTQTAREANTDRLNDSNRLDRTRD